MKTIPPFSQAGTHFTQHEMAEEFSKLSDDELSTHELLIQHKLEVIDDKITRLRTQKSQLLELVEAIKHVRQQRKSQRTDTTDWTVENFTWSVKARHLLQTVFRLENYRPQQLRTINALMAGNDVLLLAPTGGGKSLCFQLPALLSAGVTVVISPLISLMEDQVWSLERINVAARLLCSTTDKTAITQIHKTLSEKRSPDFKLLYVTPERLSKSKRFMTALQKCYNNGHLDRFAIDEVHCCSQWGHDFRPDYKFLGVLKEMFPKTPILGVTATATTRVIDDVQQMLKIPDAIHFVASFNRPNLYYHVLEKPVNRQEQYDLLANLMVTRFRKQSGIVYTFSMKDAVDICNELNERGLKVAPYHANLETADRTKIHQLWHSGDLQAVVATVAFGMGINKGNVRFVIHHTMSKSMENFYQESGRAGRDGARADCILLYHFADIFRITTMTFSENMGLKNAYAMVNYCISTDECRRKIISRYFSEVWGAENCNGMCDRCTNNDRVRPGLEIAPYATQLRTIIAKADAEQKSLTGLKLVDAWMQKGPTNLRLNEPAPLLSRAVAEQIVAYLIVHNYLKESFVFTPYATISYIKKGPADVTEEESLKFPFGKLFPLPTTVDATNGHTPSTSGTRKRINGRTENSVKRKVAKAGDRTSSSSEENDHEYIGEEEVVVIPEKVEVIEIDGD
uniref:ATP-dependent DNA helicase n=1 Tax=Anopheles farauti TaxID=69004 RepID=A0A182QCV6_9DIPT